MNEKDIEIKVGRRSVDGIVRLTAHPPQLVQLSVSYKGERTTSVVLTRSQVRTLQRALAELEETLSKAEGLTDKWDLNERRAAREPHGELILKR